jgi:nicotinamidase-related amidase
MTSGLHAPLGRSALHLVIDMQVIFDSHPEWGMADLRRILPQVLRLTKARPDQTYCTRFIPAHRAEDAIGIWQRYYRHWQSATLDQAGWGAVELVPELAALPIAGLIDKPGFSAHSSPDLAPLLKQREIDTLVLSGVETDVCVWASVMTAIDQGLRVVIASDAVASGDLQGHEAILHLAAERFGLQIDLASVDEILAGWTA